MATRGINKVILVGNLGKDPEIRYMPNGEAVANFSLATSESWKDKQSGEQKELTEWHRVVAYKKLAEIIGEYVKKGAKIYIEGKLRTRKWQNKEGHDVYTTEIIADVMQMLDGKSIVAENAPNESNGGSKLHQAPVSESFDDDIPF